MRRISRSPEQLAYGWRDALVDRDAGAFAALFAPEGVMIDVEHRTEDLRRARPIHGRAAIEELTIVWLRDTPRFLFAITGLLADASTAAYRWSYELAGASDSVAVEGVTWLTCADGMIDEALVCFDSYALMEGLGTVRPAGT
ncbi:MAG: SnoaL-like polyketide cyclase [Gaiellales bacterium]|nr:SnoaL-like polyketide cyclase [Gaiellales bacterium]